jgi:hypothetical protein
VAAHFRIQFLVRRGERQDDAHFVLFHLHFIEKRVWEALLRVKQAVWERVQGHFEGEVVPWRCFFEQGGKADIIQDLVRPVHARFKLEGFTLPGLTHVTGLGEENQHPGLNGLFPLKRDAGFLFEIGI